MSRTFLKDRKNFYRGPALAQRYSEGIRERAGEARGEKNFGNRKPAYGPPWWESGKEN
jgi:hypothetical protein